MLGNGQLKSPYGVVTDSIGNVYVADTMNNRIQKFDSNGAFLSQWGSDGSGDGQFAKPCGIAVDSAGNIYVLDTDNGRIQKFASNGSFVSKWGSKGNGDGQLNIPMGVSVDSAGNVYVADTGNHRIQKFNSNGDFVAKWGKNGGLGSGDSDGSGAGEFASPGGTAVDSSGNVYVADTMNDRIQKRLSTWKTVTFYKNSGDAEADPAAITVVSGDNVGTLPVAPTKSGYAFSGWNTAADGSGTAFKKDTAVSTDLVVYAQWSKNSDTGTVTGGGGGGGGTATTPTTTVSGSTATTTVTPTVSGGIATGAVTESQMNNALKKAQVAAGTSSTPNVEIQISGASGANSVGTTILHASMQTLVSGGVGALTISGLTGSVSFDTQALKTISGASGDVTVTVAKTDSSTLSGAAQELVGSHPVFNFSVTSGGSAISQFGGDVTVSVPYTPASGEDTNAIVIYYIAADGMPTLVQNARYDAATDTVIFTTTHFSTYTVGYNKVNFTDVSNTSWYENAVTFLAARGITTGTTATTFSPDATLTRGQFITLFLKAYGVEAVTNPKDNFSDAGDTYYTGYLAAAKSLGISNGVGNNKFAPEAAITRQEMFALLYNALKVLDKLPEGSSGKTLSDFTDSDSVAAYAQEAMSYLVKTGVVSGNNGLILPQSTTTRAQMAQVLYNLLGK